MASVDSNLEELMAHLGDFGKYQCWQFSLHVLGALTAGLHMLTLLTVAAVPPHKCNIPEFTSMVESLNDTSSSWNSSAIADGVPRHVGSCHYLDSNNMMTKCDSWSYDTQYFQSSRAMEWNFVCSQRWMARRGAVLLHVRCVHWRGYLGQHGGQVRSEDNLLCIRCGATGARGYRWP